MHIVIGKARRVIVIGLAAFCAVAALSVWLFTRPGTIGLYRWGYGTPFIALLGLGAAALAIAIASARFPAAKALRVVSVVVSCLVVVLAAGVGGFIAANAYGRLPPAAARPVLPDPAAGIAVPPGRGLRVALSSDPHFDRDLSAHDARRRILRLAQEERDRGELDAFFMLGDYVEQGFMAAGWDVVLSELRELMPRVPLYALMGNHDAMLGGARRWLSALGVEPGRPASGEASARPSPYMWRVNAGTVHFIAVDLPWGPEDLSKAERAWLEDQLASIPAADFTVVLSHSFFYCSGYVDESTGMPWFDHADNLRLVAPMLAGRADLVVSGHNHYMEWIEADGTAWAIVGAMGGKPDPEPTHVSPGSVWFARGEYGRLVLELEPDGLHCSFEDDDGETLFERTLAAD